MSKEEDFLRFVLRLVMEAAPSFSEAQAEQIERQVRHDYGGERPFIAKRGPMLRRAREKVMATVGTKPDKEVARENGISRATMYRYLSKGGK